MTTALEDITHDRFKRAVFSDDSLADLGYPNDVSFVAEDMDGVDMVIWRNVHVERRPTVLVTAQGVEVLIEPHERPLPMRWVDRLRGRTHVLVKWRPYRDDAEYALAVETDIGRRPVADMRRLAHA